MTVSLARAPMLAQLDVLRQDLIYAVRQLRRSPGYTIVALGSLAVGIGANISIYSAAHAVLQRQPDASHPEELVRVYRGNHSPLPRDWFLELSQDSRTLQQLIAEDPVRVGLDLGSATEPVTASLVSPNFFSGLGVGPALGAVFSGDALDRPGAVSVLSHDYWTARLGRDPAIIGRTIRLNNVPFTVLGVARQGFRSSQFGWGPAVFVPLSEHAALRGVPAESLGQSSFYITGRLAAGRTPQQAEAEILGRAPSLPGGTLELSKPGAFTVESARGITAEIRTPAALVAAFLMAVVGTVLLIACANLANLLLARAAGRRREIAIRIALGVRRPRLVRQLLTESVLVSALGGIAGLGMAYYVTRRIPALVPREAELVFDVTPDLHVLVFATLLAVATGIVFGLAPALHSTRADVQSVLRAETGGSGRRHSKLRSSFLVAQVGLATLLLVTAALFLQSLGKVQQMDVGFRTERVVDVGVDLSLRQYDEERGQVFYRELLERVRSLAPVENASLIRYVPLTGSRQETGASLVSADPDDLSAIRTTSYTVVAPGYFEMFGVPMVRGRAFDAGDRQGALPVAVVNESFARMLWPRADAVGQTVRFGGSDILTVVGVSRDTKYVSLGERNTAFLYLPLAQAYQSSMVLQVRLKGGTPAERDAVRRLVQSLEPGLPPVTVTSLNEDMKIALLPARAGAGLTGVFGALALFLATIGVYGVTAYLVGQRTREIGVRAALGAGSYDVLRLVMGETLVLVFVGLGLGLAGGVAIGVAISGWLHGVGALDPMPLAGAAVVLLTVAGFGTWMPARRALMVDPLVAMRAD
ncbi:MAG: ABC transporter permease [Gemmatimonadetes bacterium]|nr:ABC transporter permease [Gemmatimonadota bacterium]